MCPMNQIQVKHFTVVSESHTAQTDLGFKGTLEPLILLALPMKC